MPAQTSPTWFSHAQCRANARSGIRLALGATRLRLIRQVLVESLVLSGAASVCAVLVAWWAVGILKAAIPDNVPRVTTIAVDLRVLAAAAGLSLVTGILFGIVPALAVTKPRLADALKEGGRTGVGTGGRLRAVLIVSEIALAVVLLVGAALFISSFIAVIRVDPGFNVENLLTAQVSPLIDPRTEPSDSGAAFADLVERISHIPGVLQASMIGANVPLLGGYSATSLTIPDKNIDLTANEMIGTNSVTPDYHAALKIPLRRGRFFDRTDRKDGPSVVIINESAARKYFPEEDPIGRKVGIGGTRTIVGVVGDVHQTSLEMEPRPEAYLPMAQTRVFGGSLVIRTSGKPYDRWLL